MDDLVKLLEANGIATKTGSHDADHVIHFEVEGEQIKVSVRESVRSRKRDLTVQEASDQERHPSIYRKTFDCAYDSTGRLTFEIENYSETRTKWTDTKKSRLEEYSHQIVFGLRAVAAFEKRRRAEREAERKRNEIEQRRRMKQQERIDRLKTNLTRWEEAERIRAYLAVVRQKNETPEGGIEETNLISRFLAWAERYADSLDSSGAGASPDWAEEI
jgi:hypothetical protein